jgi:leucyl-tRNA synthetase
VHDPEALAVAEVEYAVQVNGKVRGRFRVASGSGKDDVVEQAKALPEVRPHVAEKVLMKVVFVENRLVNLVVI